MSGLLSSCASSKKKDLDSLPFDLAYKKQLVDKLIVAFADELMARY